MSREDPKPGRWILPLVVAGLIGFTYVFVNALPQAEVSANGSDTVTGSSTTSTTTEPTTSTSTTLNPDAAAFIERTQAIGRNVGDLATLAQQINDDFDTDDAEFGPTRDALEDLEAQTNTLVEEEGGLEVPSPATEEWVTVTDAMADLDTAAADMLDGLVNAPGSEPRLEALEDYKAAAAAITNALGRVRRAVRDPAA